MEHVSQGKADLSCANVQLILKAYSARKQVLLKKSARVTINLMTRPGYPVRKEEVGML